MAVIAVSAAICFLCPCIADVEENHAIYRQVQGMRLAVMRIGPVRLFLRSGSDFVLGTLFLQDVVFVHILINSQQSWIIFLWHSLCGFYRFHTCFFELASSRSMTSVCFERFSRCAGRWISKTLLSISPNRDSAVKNGVNCWNHWAILSSEHSPNPWRHSPGLFGCYFSMCVCFSPRRVLFTWRVGHFLEEIVISTLRYIFKLLTRSRNGWGSSKA